MNIIKSLLLLITITLGGNLLSAFIDGVLPGSVIGMVILFILLITKTVKLDFVENTSLYLVSHLPLFILPGAISIITAKGLTLKDIFLICLVALLSTLLTITVTAVVAEALLKISGEAEND